MAYQVVDIKNFGKKKMIRSLSIPSSIHSFSVCIEYMKNWFLEKFGKDYFKTVYIDSKHVIDDFRTLSEVQKLKRQKPMVAIVPQLDFAFDREKIDACPFGLEIYAARGEFRNSFFKDEQNDMYLGMGLECNLIKFTYRMRFNTRAQQMDMFKYIKLACRVGFTQGKDNDMDFHIPYGLMLQIASDAGFAIKDNKIVNIIEFMHYLNSHSDMIFLYKFRCINGKDEFFLRVPNLYTHISVTDISADDGEREGQLQNNFGIEMEAEVRFPSPQMYAYYSETDHSYISLNEEVPESISVYTLQLGDVPKVNDKGWQEYICTDYEDDNITTPLSINMNDLFAGGNIARVIEYNKSINISSSVFLDIKLYNNGKLINSNIDWNTMILTTEKPVESYMSSLVIYADLDYLTNTIATLTDADKTRIK